MQTSLHSSSQTWRARIRLPQSAISTLVASGADLLPATWRPLADGRWEVDAILTEPEIAELEATSGQEVDEPSGWEIEPLTELTGIAAARLAEVSTHNRFAAGLEHYDEQRDGGYMTVDEVNAALVALRWSYPQLVTLIELPQRTWEGRRSFAVRLRADTRDPSRDATRRARTGVLVTGGMLGRDWGGSDISVRFALRLVQAYSDGFGLAFGNKAFTAEQVRVALEELDLFIFPLVNPDGKARSQSMGQLAGGKPGGLHHVWTRGNGNPRAAERYADSGVEINRNFEFLWKATRRSGEQPCSEPEARNVRHLLAAYPGIGYFVNLTAGGNRVLMPWGHAPNRHRDAASNSHVAGSGMSHSGDYRAFMSPLDGNTFAALAGQMAAASQAVRGRKLRFDQAADPSRTTGSATNYAYSRHLSNRGSGKVYALTVEYGDEPIPPYAEMTHLVNEVGAALMELAWTANSAVYIRNNSADQGRTASSGPFWNSPDIWVRNNADGGTLHQHALRGRDNFVSVRVHHRGPAEAHGVVVRLYMATSSGAMYVYPQDWLPRPPSGGAMGSAGEVRLIGDAEIPVIAVGGKAVVSLVWRRELIAAAPGEAVTLLVEVSPQRPGDWGEHVWHNPNLAQKNVTVIGERPVAHRERRLPAVAELARAA